MLLYFLDMPSLFKPPVDACPVHLVSLDILDYSVRQAISSKYENVSSVSLTPRASLYAQVYTKGIFVSLATTNGLPDFAKIPEVPIVVDKASFIIESFFSGYLENL